MVVLDEVGGDAVLGESLLVIVLDEEAALVAEEPGVDQQDALEASFGNLDLQRVSPPLPIVPRAHL